MTTTKPISAVSASSAVNKPSGCANLGAQRIDRSLKAFYLSEKLFELPRRLIVLHGGSFLTPTA